jgi:cystathionine gamma-synthase
MCTSQTDSFRCRFFVNKLIAAFAEDIIRKYGEDEEQAMLFPSSKVARRCVDFIVNNKDFSVHSSEIRVLDLVLDPNQAMSETIRKLLPCISAVVLPKKYWSVAKQYWQHSGDGVSSRRAEFCHSLFQEGLLVEATALRITQNGQQRLCKGPKRYQRGTSIDKTSRGGSGNGLNLGPSKEKIGPTGTSENRESSLFVEERYGRNLDISFVDNAKSAIKRRIAGSLTAEVDLAAPLSPVMSASTRGVTGLSEDDVYLYPCGMNSIFNAHQMMLEARGSMKSIVFGFPYVDTLKIVEKFGPGCIFYGHGSSEDLDDLEKRLKSGERFLALFCEFPGNPLLSSPDLQRIRQLADLYDFGVIIDETIGNFINVHVLPYGDIVVSSLTKIFTGECNVMGGSAIINPQGKYYNALKKVLSRQYEDNYWVEDAIFMERNSRDFVSRIDRINHNAEEICDILKSHPLVKAVYYPKYAPSRPYYDACRTVNGGYGGLLSVTFQNKAQSIAFFDEIKTAKGPSLGTNFTLTSPYVILAHFIELDWAATFGVEPDLIRISVGLEAPEELKATFQEALKAAEKCAVTV